MSVSLVAEVWALLVKLSVAFAVPLVCGLKVTVNGTLCPAVIVIGNDKPLTLNTELFELAAVTVTFAPLTFRLADAVPLLPTTTLPTAKVPGVTISCPTVPVPVPDSAMVRFGFNAVELMVTMPLALPEDCGANTTVNVAR